MKSTYKKLLHSLVNAPLWKRKQKTSQNQILKKTKQQNSLLLRRDNKENSCSLKALPPFVGLATDDRCNLKCIMCISRIRDYKFLDNTIEENCLIKFAEQVFPTAEILQLNTAGEPLMSRHFELELELAEKYDVKLDVITNGTLLNIKKGRLQKLARNAKAVQFSFDSPIKKTYESIRVGADFDRVVENMRLFQKFRRESDTNDCPSFNINMVLMKRNLKEVPDMVRFVKDIGADHLSISRVYVHMKEMEEDSLNDCQEEVNNMLLTAKQLATRLQIPISIPPLYHVADEIQSEAHEQDFKIRNSPEMLKRCFFLWERAYIDTDANILVCCEPSHPIAGNLKDNNFQEIWNGKIYQAMRRTFTGGPVHNLCYDCAKSGYLSSLTQ